MPYIQGKFGKLPEVTKDNQSYSQKEPVDYLHTNKYYYFHVTDGHLQRAHHLHEVAHPTQSLDPLE